MSGVIDSLEREQLRRHPAFDAGDRVRVHFQVVEGTRRRTQVFEGVVLKRQGGSARETFTVRKQSFGVGVERTFPLHSPKIEQIEVASRGEVRRAKLYYLRGRVGRRARIRERRDTAGGPVEVFVEPIADAGGAQDEAATADVGVPEPEEGADEQEAGGGDVATADAGTADAGDQPDGSDAPADAEPGGADDGEPSGAADDAEPGAPADDAEPR